MASAHGAAGGRVVRRGESGPWWRGPWQPWGVTASWTLGLADDARVVTNPANSSFVPGRPRPPTGNWRVRAEQIVLIYRNTPAILASSMVTCLLIGAMLWDAAPAMAIVVWIGLIMAVSAARLCLVLAFRRFARSQDMERWEGYALAGIACGSVLWGGGSHGSCPLSRSRSAFSSDLSSR